MKLSTKIIISIIAYVITAIGISLVLKADIGYDSYNAFGATLSNLTGLKIGTILMLMNYTFVIIYIITTKGKFLSVYTIQIIALALHGSLINLIYYSILEPIVIASYPLQLITFIVGIGTCGLAVGVITVLKVITFPVEATCHQIETLGIISFVKARYSLDFFFILMALLLPLVFQSESFIREGTVIGMLSFSFFANASKSFVEKRLNIIKNTKSTSL